MATYVNDGSINWNGNWQTTSKVDTLHASTAVSCGTGGSVSGTWNGNASNTDRGALIYMTAVNACTVTVTLQEYATSTWNDRVSTTFAVTAATKINTWHYYKYSATHTETAGSANYRIQVKTSTSSISCRGENGTPTNVAVIQVLNATGTLAAADNMYVCGVVQASSVNPTAATVTVNINDSSTLFGGTWVNDGGTLAYGTSAATTYYMRTSGAIGASGSAYTMIVENGGTFNIGTTGTPMPSDSTATLELACNSVNRNIVWNTGCTISLQGYPKFGGTPTYFRCITTDAIAAVGDRTVSTSINVQTAGWVANDLVMISTTNASGAAQTEIKTISSVSGSSLTITADWTNTHLAGAEICNLTRNVNIVGNGTSSSYEAKIWYASTTTPSQCNIDYVVFNSLRSNVNYYGCLSCTYTTGGQRWNVDNSVFYLCMGDTYRPNLFINGDNTCSNLVWWLNYVATYAVYGMSYTTATGVTFNDCSVGGLLTYGFLNYTIGWINLNRVHIYDKPNNATAAYGVYSEATATVIMDGCKIWGLRGTTASSYALLAYRGQMIKCYNCYFGNDGTNNSNNYGDVYNYLDLQVYLYNCILASTNPALWTGSYFQPFGRISSHRHQRVAGRHITWLPFGSISDQITGGQAESWARGGAGYCTYLNPAYTTAGYALNWDFYVPVTAGCPFQVSFYVKTTQTSSGPTLTCTVYDSHDNWTVLLNAASVTLTAASDWTLYTTSAITPTDTGFCRVRLACLNGASTGDVGVDDVRVVY